MSALMPTAAATAATSSGWNTRSIGWPMSTPTRTRTGADEQGDLEARPEGHRHRELHLVLPGELDGDEVLGQVADRRDEHDADEERRQPERLDERLDRVDQDLRQDGQQARRRQEHDDRRRRAVQAGPAWPAAARGRRASRFGLVNWKTSADRVADDQEHRHEDRFLGDRAARLGAARPPVLGRRWPARTARSPRARAARRWSRRSAGRTSACRGAARRPARWRPSTSSRLPMIEPVIDALTTSISPAWRAKNAMISSAMLPNVALRMPPTCGPLIAPEPLRRQADDPGQARGCRPPTRRTRPSCRRGRRSRGRSRRRRAPSVASSEDAADRRHLPEHGQSAGVRSRRSSPDRSARDAGGEHGSAVRHGAVEPPSRDPGLRGDPAGRVAPGQPSGDERLDPGARLGETGASVAAGRRARGRDSRPAASPSRAAPRPPRLPPDDDRHLAAGRDRALGGARRQLAERARARSSRGASSARGDGARPLRPAGARRGRPASRPRARVPRRAPLPARRPRSGPGARGARDPTAAGTPRTPSAARRSRWRPAPRARPRDPGSARRRRPPRAQAAASSPPGSLTAGVPASVTRARSAPPRRCASSSGRRARALRAW